MINALSLFGMLSIGIAWLVPTHFLPWMSWHSEVPAFFGVILLAWCGWQRMQKASPNGHIAVPLAVLPFAMMAIIAFAQRLGGLIPFWGNVWTIWLYLALCIAGITFGRAALAPGHNCGLPDANKESCTNFALILAIFSIIATAISFAQVFSLGDNSGWIVQMIDIRRPGGNLAQPNHLATIQAMGAASALYLFSQKKMTTFSLSLLLGYLGSGVAITESRTGALSITVLLLWWLRLETPKSATKRIWLPVAIWLLFVSMFLAWPHILNSLLLTDEATMNLTSSSRLVVWRQLLSAVVLHPWVGWGIGGVSKAHNAVASNYDISSPFTYSHNIILDMVLWLGIPASIALIVPCSFWGAKSMVQAKKPLQWYAIAIFIPLGIHSLFEYPFAYGYILAPPIMFLGFVAYKNTAKPLVLVSPNIAACFLVTCSVMMALSVKDYLKLNQEFTYARFEAARIGLAPHLADQQQTILLTQLAAMTRAARWTPSRSITVEQLDLLQRIALQYPWVATQYRYAVALALSGQKTEAERQFKVMRAHYGTLKFLAVRAAVHELAEDQFPELGKLSLPD